MDEGQKVLMGMTAAELKEVARQLGMPAFTGGQIAQWLYQKHVSSIDEMTNISRQNRELLASHYEVGALPPVASQHSADGTVKYLYPVRTFAQHPSPITHHPTPNTQHPSPNTQHPSPITQHPSPNTQPCVETVFIPDGERATLCVSCQVGCKMNCLFCQTGKQGWQGDLTAADILNQVYSLPERDRLTNIVFMGQGEPMDNLDAVLRATEILTSPTGYAWSPKRITVSSVGVKGRLKRFLDESQCHIAISLHSPLPDQRLFLMPAEKAMPIEDTLRLLRQYDFTHQRRCSFEYICFAGLNDTPAHARAIVRLLSGLECRVNLIRFHRIPGVDLPASDEHRMEQLRDTLTRHGITTTIRASRGQDILAACGLLSTAMRCYSPNTQHPTPNTQHPTPNTQHPMEQQNRKPRVAITHGDTNGVGYEVILKTFAEPAILELCTPIVYGSPKVAAYHSKALGLDTPFTIIADASGAKDEQLNMLTTFDEEIKIDLGQPTPESAQAALTAIDRALDDYGKNLYDVLVTAPVFKNSIKDFNGHTAYIESKIGEGQHGLTILMNDDLRVALVTNNVAIKDIAESITKQKIVDKALLFHQALRRDLRVSSPRIAVLSLNPRCGEDGVLGTEEQELIIPAINELVEQGLQVFGPYAADDFFGRSSYYRFDGVLAMYHDQGQTPFKAVAYENGVRFTTGLPLVRTAPAHGANFAAAGKGITDEQSLRNAIYTAIDVWRNRQNYDEPLENPLPKLYHERRDDSEKVRFKTEAQPSRH